MAHLDISFLQHFTTASLIYIPYYGAMILVGSILEDFVRVAQGNTWDKMGFFEKVSFFCTVFFCALIVTGLVIAAVYTYKKIVDIERSILGEEKTSEVQDQEQSQDEEISNSHKAGPFMHPFQKTSYTTEESYDLEKYNSKKTEPLPCREEQNTEQLTTEEQVIDQKAEKLPDQEKTNDSTCGYETGGYEEYSFVSMPESVDGKMCSEQEVAVEDIADCPIIEKYKKIIRDANLLADLDAQIKLVKTPLEKGVSLATQTYDKEKGLKFKVTIKENFIESVRHHELVQEFQVKNLTPENYILSNLLMDQEDTNKFDKDIDGHTILCHYTEDEVFYYVERITVKKNMFMAGKELIIANAVIKLDDGKYIQTFKSVEDPDFERGNNNLDRLDVKNGIYYFEPFQHETDNENTYYNIINYQFMDPIVNVNIKVVKTFLGNHFKKFYKNMFPVFERLNEEGKNDWQEKLDQISASKWTI